VYASIRTGSRANEVNGSEENVNHKLGADNEKMAKNVPARVPLACPSFLGSTLRA
jgi:hypothetical protein